MAQPSHTNNVNHSKSPVKVKIYLKWQNNSTNGYKKSSELTHQKEISALLLNDSDHIQGHRNFHRIASETMRSLGANRTLSREPTFLEPLNSLGKVVELTDENFDKNIMMGAWFVEFYADWCIHCQNFIQGWENVAANLSNQIKIGRIEITKNIHSANKFYIHRVPTFIFFPSGGVKPEGIYYDGTRKVETMVKWASDQGKVVNLEYEEFINTIIHGKQSWIIEVYAVKNDEYYNLLPTLKTVGSMLTGHVKVGQIYLPANLLLKTQNHYPAFYFFNGMDHKGTVYHGNRTVDDLVAWAIQQSRAIKLSYDAFNENMLYGTEPLLVGFYAKRNRYIEQLLCDKIAYKLSGSLNMAIVDYTFKEIGKYFNISKSPTFILFHSRGVHPKGIQYSGNYSTDLIVQWAMNIIR